MYVFMYKRLVVKKHLLLKNITNENKLSNLKRGRRTGLLKACLLINVKWKITQFLVERQLANKLDPTLDYYLLCVN